MAVNYSLPNWIKGADTAGAYARGFPLGLQAAEAAARLQHIQQQMQLEAQRSAIAAQHQQMALELAQQREQRDSIQKQQELEVLKSYHEQQNQIHQQDIAQKEEKIQQAAALVAHKYQAQTMMMATARQLIAGGMKPEEAYMRAAMQNPETSGSAMAALGKAIESGSGGELAPQVQTARIGDRDVPLIVNPKTGHFQVVPEAKNPLENAKDLTSILNTMSQQPRSKARDAAISDLQGRLNKTLGLAAESPKGESPNPIKSIADYVKGKLGLGTAPDTATGDIPDWAALPGEDQAPSSLSDIASRIKAGPAAPAEADFPDYAKLPGEDLTGPIPITGDISKKDLQPDQLYLHPDGKTLLEWNPEKDKFVAVEPPAPDQSIPESEADLPLPGEE